MSLATILLDVHEERRRQEQLKADGRFQATLADFPSPLSASDALAVCSEEFGEVAEIVADSLTRPGKALDRAHLREELIQLAACCVAWCEQLDAIEADRAEMTTAVGHILEVFA